MRTSKIAAALGALTGLVWMVAGALSWQRDALGERSHMLWLGGVGGFGLTMGVLGYAVVATAPVWLRVVVFVCAAALGASVPAVIDPDASWSYAVVGTAGLVLVLLGAAGLARVARRSAPPQPATSSRRASRGGRRAAR